MIFNPFWITLIKLFVVPGTSSTSPVSAPEIYIYIYIYIWNRLIGLVGRVFANGPGDRGSIPGRVIPKTLKKCYLIPPCLTLSIIRYVSRVKQSKSGKGVAPSPTPQCSSYWEGSLWVALDYSRQLTNIWELLFVCMCLYIQAELKSNAVFFSTGIIADSGTCNMHQNEEGGVLVV